VTSFDRRDQIASAVGRIARDHRRGASSLADAALSILLLAKPSPDGGTPRGWVRSVVSLGDRLAALRPSMPAIENAVARTLAGFAAQAKRAGSPAEAYAFLAARVRAQRTDLRRAREQTANTFAREFSWVRRPLVYSASSAAAASLIALRRAPQRVTVCESRPLFEGRRMARQLRSGLTSRRPIEVITEAQAGLALGTCDIVVVGCDAIFADGSVANKAGTALIAGAARRHGVPLLVVGDSYRYAARSRYRTEQHPPAEVWRNPPPGVRPRNTAFEVVPAQLIHRIVIEQLVLRTQQVRRHWKRRRSTGAGA
jgi:translation initiation factor 2B subunit (eIF-2B alpha/beta/delta family)